MPMSFPGQRKMWKSVGNVLCMMGELIGEGEKVSVLACQDCVNHDVLQCPPFHMFNHDSQLVHVEE